MNYALTALLVFCLIAWGFVLVPPAVRLLSGVIRPSDSIGSFRNKMAVLAGATPSSLRGAPVTAPIADRGELPASIPASIPAAAAPPSQVLDLAAHRRSRPGADLARRRAAKRRRRNVFTGLLASVPVTFLLAVVAGGAGWMLFLVSVAAFAGYTFLLWQMHQTALERSRKVAVLPTTARPAVQSGDMRRISLVGR